MLVSLGALKYTSRSTRSHKGVCPLRTVVKSSVEEGRMMEQVVIPPAAKSNCVVCHGNGICFQCRGTGKSGYFLLPPSSSAPACWQCKGSGRCRDCRGAGAVVMPAFSPAILVTSSLQRPTSITVAAATGAGWRYLPIPARILLRTAEAQTGWVTWRVQTHFRHNQGKLCLFGDILGYVWRRSSVVRVQSDTRGQLLQLGHEWRR